MWKDPSTNVHFIIHWNPGCFFPDYCAWLKWGPICLWKHHHKQATKLTEHQVLIVRFQGAVHPWKDSWLQVRVLQQVRERKLVDRELGFPPSVISTIRLGGLRGWPSPCLHGMLKELNDGSSSPVWRRHTLYWWHTFGCNYHHASHKHTRVARI